MVTSSKPERAIVWNYGGGTQSAAIAVLISQGRLPRPEVAVIADTGREDPSTWAYMRDYVQPLLSRTVGLEIQVAPRSLARVDLYSHKGMLLLPVFTRTGKLQTFCSDEWKGAVVRRFLRGSGYGPKRPIVQWIGFSTDEILRIKQETKLKWTQRHWPLVLDLPHSRADCVRVVMQAGLPRPPKSSCWMCPHRNNEQWRNLRTNSPAMFAKAVALDEEIRERDTMGGVYLHRSLVPLSEVDLSEAPVAQRGMFDDDPADDCGSGLCFV